MVRSRASVAAGRRVGARPRTAPLVPLMLVLAPAAWGAASAQEAADGTAAARDGHAGMATARHGAARVATGRQAADRTRHLSVPGLRLGAQVVGVVTRVSPALDGRTMTEGALTQPVVMGHGRWLGGRLGVVGMLNLEGATLAGGELSPGLWGEGYVDRRHPHTYLHELVGSSAWAFGGAGGEGVSVSAGRGFAPFGTDDPLVRPLVRFPVNHHLAQIPERLVAIGAARVGPVVVEAGLFNGNEPERPRDLGTLDRFGDSWAVRGTLAPRRGWELQASRAYVESPEHAGGGGLDQWKWSVSARYEGGRGRWGRPYALVEWARTDEHSGGRGRFRFDSVLAEGAVDMGSWEVAARLERTTRPEEERLLDPFRSPRPHADLNILGATRWATVGGRVARRVGPVLGVTGRPFIEVTWLKATETIRPTLFVPREFYGSDTIWSVSLGVKLEAGMVHRRMGRYGVAAGAAEPADAGRHH